MSNRNALYKRWIYHNYIIYVEYDEMKSYNYDDII